MYDIIIVGAGPAGLTAALYALRANKKVLLLEAKAYGGKIINASKIENYPGIENISGYDFATNLYNQVMNLGGEIKYESVLKVNEDKEVTTSKDTYKAKAIIIATGLSNKKLDIPNAEEYLGKGLSYCAVCDGNFFKGKIVAVVGSGNNALEDAIYLSDIASKVYLINHSDSFKGEELKLEKINNINNIEIMSNTEVISINGENVLEGIKVKKDNEEQAIKINGLFIDIGFVPANYIFNNVLEFDEKGYIKTIDSVKTNVKGIYVAGDNRVKELRQLTTAVSDGSLAATIAVKELDD